MKEELMGMLVRMEQAVATAAPAVWGAAVRQAQVEGLTSIVWAVLWAVLCVAAAKAGAYFVRLAKEDDEPGFVAAAFALAVFALAAACACVSQVSYACAAIANPEWQAMKLLAEMIQ